MACWTIARNVAIMAGLKSNSVKDDDPGNDEEGHPSKDAHRVEGLQGVATWVDLAALGVHSSTLGGSMVWNVILGAGFLPALLAQTISGAAIVILMVCLAELASALPFSGGMYGYVRLTIGRNTAVIAALLQIICYLTVGFAIAFLGCLSYTEAFGTAHHLMVIWGFIIYGFVAAVQLKGGVVLWRTVRVVGALCFLTQLVYWCFCFATPMSITNAALPDVEGSAAYTGTTSGFFASLNIAAGMFIGLESLPLSSEDTVEARRQMPKGMIRGTLFVVVVSCLHIFIMCTARPGLMGIAGALLPAVPLFEQFMSPKAANVLAAIFSMPAAVGMVLGGSHGASRIIFALSRAGVLPEMLGQTRDGTAFNATIAVNMIGWVTLAIMALVGSPDAVTIFLNTTILCCFCFYVLVFVCFIVLCVKHKKMARFFHSPLGIQSAVFGIVFFVTALVSLLMYAPLIMPTVVVTLVMLGLLASYYMCYAHFNLKLSPEDVISIDAELSKDINLDDLLKDLERVIDSDRRGLSVLQDIFEDARKVKAEEALRLGVGVSKLLGMSRAMADRPAILQEAGRLIALHLGEEAPQRVAVPPQAEAHVQAVLLKASRRRVLFADDVNEVLDTMTSLLGQLSLQLSSVLRTYVDARIGEFLAGVDDLSEGSMKHSRRDGSGMGRRHSGTSQSGGGRERGGSISNELPVPSSPSRLAPLRPQRSLSNLRLGHTSSLPPLSASRSPVRSPSCVVPISEDIEAATGPSERGAPEEVPSMHAPPPSSLIELVPAPFPSAEPLTAPHTQHNEVVYNPLVN